MLPLRRQSVVKTFPIFHELNDVRNLLVARFETEINGIYKNVHDMEKNNDMDND